MSDPVQLVPDELRILIQHYRKPQSEDVRLRSHAIILAHKKYTIAQIADILLRDEQTIFRWIKAFQKERIVSLFPKYFENEHASKLTRAQKQELGKIFSQKPSEYGIPAAFWDISNLKTYIKAEFGVEYASVESYRIIFKLHNYSFHLPDTFDTHRDEGLITKRMAEIKEEIAPMMQSKDWMIFASDESRIVWETIIRRLWLPKGKKSIIKVERKRQAQSFIGFLNLQTGEDLLFKMPWQNQEEIVIVLEDLVKKYPDKRICIIWDNAAFHKGKLLREKLSTALKNIHLINLPPYAPDHNPQEHVWKYGKDKLANNQRGSLEETTNAFVSIVTGRRYNYQI